jgi:hypothetical protein
MQRMETIGGFLKGLLSAIVAGIALIDKTFTPCIWLLLALVAVDLILNVHKEGQQMHKLFSAAGAMGIPTFIGTHYDLPNFAQYLTVLMTVAYIQVVFPQIVDLLKKVKWSKDPATQAAITADAEMIAQLVQAELQKVVEAQKAKLDAQTPEPFRPAPLTQDQSKVD